MCILNYPVDWGVFPGRRFPMLCNGIKIKAGQFWEDGRGQRYKIDHVSTCSEFLYPVMAFSEDMETCLTFMKDGKHIVDGDPDDDCNLTKYLPGCTGFDWVAPPVQQYRDLAPNELVEEGDEYSVFGHDYKLSGNWHDRISRKKQTSFFKYRRPINPPAKRTQAEYWLSPALTDADNIAYIQRRPEADAKYDAVCTDGTVMCSSTHRSPDWTVLFEDEAKARLQPPGDCCEDLAENFVSAQPMYVAAADIDAGDLVVIKNGFAYPVVDEENEDDVETVDPGEGYRLLGEDEERQVGDEFLIDFRKWTTYHCGARTPGLPYRRKNPEYLYLQNGDIIEAGDEWKAGDKWCRFRNVIGEPASLGAENVYRRDVTHTWPKYYRSTTNNAYIVRERNGECVVMFREDSPLEFEWWPGYHEMNVVDGIWTPCTERAAKESIK